MKIYESYEEINNDLKVLKLQNHIDKERIKLSVNNSRPTTESTYNFLFNERV